MEEIRKAAEEKQHRTYTAMYKHFKLYMNGATEINEDCVQKFQTFLLNHKKTNDTNLSQTSVHHYMTRLQIILAELRTKGVIAQQIKVNIVKEDRKESVYLSIDEIQRVMDAEIDEKYRVIQYAYLFSCFTGLRRSDIINLKWQDVFGDFLKIQTIKTKSYEEIALPETALYILSLLKNDGGSVFNFVMCNLRKAFDHIAEKADIKKVVRFHSSRHTFGTVLFEAGVDIYTVQRLLTHKSIASTMIYAHIKNADKKRAVDKLPNLKMKT